ncbi:MAG: SDR family oxidoreductase [Hyphomicrobium sp.]|uniref:SDR family oxidoreductase n=1 Tax=Hyphomicrobium sp. TaxID=82 RepID=UPI0035613200
MSRLKGKKALITGGTTGIGLETAARFIAEGARVAVTGSNPANIEQARKALGPSALVFRADAGNVASQKDVAKTVGDAFGKLDAVFINAGVADFRPVEQWDEAGFDRSIAVNVKGPYFLVQALLSILNDPASIVLNTSINAHLGMPNSSVYAATKAALLSMAKTLSGELIGRGVRVNAISPGPIETPLYGKLGLGKSDLDAMTKSILGQIPAARFGKASEIADAVVFFASDESAFTVGSELVIDGGMSNL